MPDRSRYGRAAVGDEPKGPGPDRGLYTRGVPRAPCGRGKNTGEAQETAPRIKLI